MKIPEDEKLAMCGNKEAAILVVSALRRYRAIVAKTLLSNHYNGEYRLSTLEKEAEKIEEDLRDDREFDYLEILSANKES